MKRCLLILLFCLVGNVVSAYSAGDTCLAKVNIDLTDDTSSVIDFGYVYVGDTLNSGVVIVRTGPNAVQLPSAAPPYFVKSTTPNSSSANDFEEFDVSINTFPFRLSNIESFKNFPIQFIARDSSIYKSGKKEAKLNFSVRGDPDASCVAVNRGITVRATKSFMPLWTDDSYLSFDSVYVNPVSQIVDTIRIHNVYKIDTIKADTTSFNYTKRAQSVFTFAPNQKLSFAPKPGFENPFVTRYFPTQRGVDSVLYKFIHKNPYYSKATPQIDTMYVTAFGVGVEQKLSIAEVQPSNAKIINDTINVGAIHAEQPDTIRIVLRNDGNIAFHHEGISLTNKETFQLEKAINVNGVFLPPDATDTLSIIINPKNEGLFESVCTIKSDISSRVRGVPVSVKEITFVITGQSIRPRIEPLSNVVRFDSVIVFDECLWDTTKTLTLRNVSNYASEITSVVVIPSNAPFFVTKQPFTLQPGNSEKVDVVFSPRTVGSFSAVLQITTKENNLPIVVNLVGKGIESKPIACKVPMLQTIKPGNKIVIPIMVDKELVALTNRFSSTIVFDSTLLKYSAWSKTGTASSLLSSNQFDIRESSRGRLQIVMQSSQYYLAKDTLVNLVFDTYLGNDIKTDVVITSSEFGRENCASALPVVYQQGIVKLDSVCGLELKVGSTSKTQFIIFPLTPNPAQDYTEVVFNIPVSTSTQFEIVNSVGVKVTSTESSVFNQGVHTLRIPIQELSEGTYTLIMKANDFIGVERFVVTK